MRKAPAWELHSDAYHDALLVHDGVRDRGVMPRVILEGHHMQAGRAAEADCASTIYSAEG